MISSKDKRGCFVAECSLLTVPEGRLPDFEFVLSALELRRDSALLMTIAHKGMTPERQVRAREFRDVHASAGHDEVILTYCRVVGSNSLLAYLARAKGLCRLPMSYEYDDGEGRMRKRHGTMMVRRRDLTERGTRPSCISADWSDSGMKTVGLFNVNGNLNFVNLPYGQSGPRSDETYILGPGEVLRGEAARDKLEAGGCRKRLFRSTRRMLLSSDEDIQIPAFDQSLGFTTAPKNVFVSCLLEDSRDLPSGVPICLTYPSSLPPEMLSKLSMTYKSAGFENVRALPEQVAAFIGYFVKNSLDGQAKNLYQTLGLTEGPIRFILGDLGGSSFEFISSDLTLKDRGRRGQQLEGRARSIMSLDGCGLTDIARRGFGALVLDDLDITFEEIATRPEADGALTDYLEAFLHETSSRVETVVPYLDDKREAAEIALARVLTEIEQQDHESDDLEDSAAFDFEGRMGEWRASIDLSKPVEVDQEKLFLGCGSMHKRATKDLEKWAAEQSGPRTVVLLVGGGSENRFVYSLIEDYFPNATFLTLPHSIPARYAAAIGAGSSAYFDQPDQPIVFQFDKMLTDVGVATKGSLRVIWRRGEPFKDLKPYEKLIDRSDRAYVQFFRRHSREGERKPVRRVIIPSHVPLPVTLQVLPRPCLNPPKANEFISDIELVARLLDPKTGKFLEYATVRRDCSRLEGIEE